MESKRLLLPAVLVFIFFLVLLFASLFVQQQEPHESHPPAFTSTSTSTYTGVQTFLLRLKNIALSAAFSVWQLNQVPVSAHLAQKPHDDRGVIGLSPNLSTCHRSIAKSDYEVYCCPPTPESEEPFVDFQFPDPSAPKRTRRPLHRADEDYIAKYRKALTIMKSLPYDNPLSFGRQADMHCIYCTGAYNQNGANVSLNVHRSWLFFPWHRMMLYFHERILANLIGDDTFALPFWNWDAPEGMVIPDLYYRDPFVDTQRSAFHVHPGKIADISYNKVEPDFPPSPEEQISMNLNFMYTQMVSGAKKVELFMGCVYKPGAGNSCDAPGTIEFAPHNALHSYVGRQSNRFLEDMGVFYAAARDPLFYAHHPNIDRLWEVWKEMRGYEPEIVDPDWLETYFFFHDENSQLVRIKVRDVLNITKLGYSYEKVDLPWLNARPRPSVDPAIARRTLNYRNTGSLAALSSDFRPNGRALDTTITVKVFRPNRPRRRTEKEEEEVVLVVYGIDVKEDMFVKFDVYVNAIDAASIGPESREFAGTYINVPRGVTLVLNEGDEKRDSKSSLRMGISELLEDLEAEEDEFIWVSLVPRGGTGVSTTIDGIRIEYMA